MKCPKCGKTFSNNYRFCEECGEKLIPSPVSQETEPTEPTPTPTPVPAPMPEPREHKPKKKKSHTKLIVILIISILVLLLVTGAILACIFLTGNNDSDTRERSERKRYEQTEETDDSEESDEAQETDEPTDEPDEILIDMDSVEDIITSYTSENNVAVSIVDFNSGETYYTDNKNTSYVASGFYAPLYLVSYSTSDTILHRKADLMMSDMDNDAANYIIESLGGTDEINSILENSDLHSTKFNRKFGDTKASNQGYENYTSAKDVATIMNFLYENGGFDEMEVILEDEGIYMPHGVTYYAHRGQGIGGAFNVYIFIQNGDVDYCISVLTSGISGDAKLIISDIISDVQKQMENIYE